MLALSCVRGNQTTRPHSIRTPKQSPRTAPLTRVKLRVEAKFELHFPVRFRAGADRGAPCNATRSKGVCFPFRNASKDVRSNQVAKNCTLSSAGQLSLDVGGGDDGNYPPKEKEYGGGDDDQEPSGRGNKLGEDSIEGVLAKLGSAQEKIPADILKAVQAGRLHPSILEIFTKLHSNVLVRPLLWFTGTRDRVLADPGFAFKVAVELGIGVFTKSAAELAKRGERFQSEIDFVTTNVLMALFADFMLVYIPAPTIMKSLSAKAPAALPGTLGTVQAWLEKCPANAFQKVSKLSTVTASFTLAQRGGAILSNGIRLLGVGFAASFTATLMTNSLIFIRRRMDKNFVPQNETAPLLQTSTCYASYMALSSNLRYQIVGGIIEERGIEVVLNKWPGLMGACCLAVRTANTFLGSLLWIDYAQFFGLQKSKEIESKKDTA